MDSNTSSSDNICLINAKYKSSLRVIKETDIPKYIKNKVGYIKKNSQISTAQYLNFETVTLLTYRGNSNVVCVQVSNGDYKLIYPTSLYVPPLAYITYLGEKIPMYINTPFWAKRNGEDWRPYFIDGIIHENYYHLGAVVVRYYAKQNMIKWDIPFCSDWADIFGDFSLVNPTKMVEKTKYGMMWIKKVSSFNELSPECIVRFHYKSFDNQEDNNAERASLIKSVSSFPDLELVDIQISYKDIVPYDD